MKPLEFYSLPEVQRAIVAVAKNREVAVKYGDHGFGKRPDIIQYEGDVRELARQGATSFHISEERWFNPLELTTGLSKDKLDSLRSGWDLIIDIDSKFIEYSKITALLIVEALRFHNVENISVKFSGGSGFHLGVPFESFPEAVNNVQTRSLFPEGPRFIASYLKEMIAAHLSARLLSINTLDEMAKALSVDREKLLAGNNFNPFSVSEIDTVLISSRHMFRAPYSFNEKKWLISMPIPVDGIAGFDLAMARPENVKFGGGFLNPNEKADASQLLIQSLDWQTRKKDKTVPLKIAYDIPKIAIPDKNFPPCITKLLAGGMTDGKKRSLFILLNFLRSAGFDYNEIEKRVMAWNAANKEHLRDNYIIAQLNWHKRQHHVILPPNCDNAAYYKDIGICCPDGLCSKIKNPANYAARKNRFVSN